MKQNDFFGGTLPQNNYIFLKRFAIAALVSLSPLVHGYAQTTTTVLENYDGIDLTTKSPTYTSGDFSIVPNPFPAGNPSANVAQYIRKGTEGFDRLFLNIGNNIPKTIPFISNDYQIVFDVYTTAPASAASPIPVVLDFTNNATYTTAWPAGIHSEYTSGGITKSNEWQTLTFSYTRTFGENASLSTQIDQLSLMLNGGTGTSDTYYIDNIRIIKQPLNLALGQPAFASSGNAALAVDGLVGGDSRCNNSGDLSVDPAPYFSVDLGASYDIKHIAAIWEGAYAETYDILISDDSSFPVDKTTVKHYDNGPGLFPAGPFPLKNDWENGSAVLGTGRYVKIVETKAGTDWGYALYEFQVFGTPAGTLGTNDVQAASAPTVAIYPNPASNSVQISFPEKLNNKVITIYDLLGKQVLQTKLDDAATENAINISQLSKGTYILNIKSDGNSWSKKLIKK
jgi:hypothetical protein